MGRKVKYDYAFKEECVKLVLEKHHSYGFVSKQKGADKSNIRKWVGFYKQYGESGLMPRMRSSYSVDFKLKVLQSIDKESLSLNETCLKFNIPTSSIFLNWKRDFANFGLEGL
jgi:transposase